MLEKKEEKFDLNQFVVKSQDVEGLKAEYKLQIDSMQAGVEPHYYWILDFLKKPGHFGLGMSGDAGRVDKLKDIYTAGVASAYWGSVEQRKGLQQDKISSYLATVGKMTKDTFQIVREIRIIKERLAFYYSSEKGDDSAEVALKGTWIDMVEGGAKNPASVYGLASQVGFAILPDLFFRVKPKTPKEVDAAVEKVGRDIGLNKKILEVLGRKLRQFMEWREKTFGELKQRERFVLKYLRQHYNTIRLYMNWLRPYLRNVRELQMRGEPTDAALAKAFDTSRIELELLGVKYEYVEETPEGYQTTHRFRKYFPAVWVNIKFTAIPMMAYQQEYQRGAIHSGTTEIAIRGVVLTEDDLVKYKEEQEKEDMEIISSVFESMEALGDEFKDYLREAGEKIEEKEVEEEKKQTVFTPFVDIFRGFGDMFGAFKIKKEKPKEGVISITKAEEAFEKNTAKKAVMKLAFVTYDVFKKSHKMLAW